MIKVGDKVKITYTYSGSTLRIYFGIIKEIEKSDKYHPKNINIKLLEIFCFLSKDKDGNILYMDRLKNISGSYFSYDKIEKIKDIESEIFLEVL